MSFFISVGIIFLAMLIQSFMQLTPGVFAFFFHSALGKTSTKKADDMSLSFIIGLEIFTALFFVIIYTIISFSTLNQTMFYDILPWILIGIFFAETIASLLFYYRKSKVSELFISRHLAKNLRLRASTVKNRSDTIILGFLSGVFELPFTLPLYIIISIIAIKNFASNDFIIILLYVFCAIIPPLIVHILYHTNHNLAFIMRFRAKNKTFFKLAISIGYLSIALLLIMETLL